MGVWHDRATGETGRLVKLFQLNRGLSFKDAIDEAREFCRMQKPSPEDRRIDPANFIFEPPPDRTSDDLPAYQAPVKATTIDWQKCVAEFTPEKAAELCEWRGFSIEMVQWMRENELIGCYNGKFAFPVQNHKGQVVGIHYRSDDAWFYYPKGTPTSALVVGSMEHAIHTLAFESQWDAFAVLDRLKAYEPENAGIYAAYITRGATSNTDLSKHPVNSLIAVTQNDPREKKRKDGTVHANTNKEGRTPAEEWLHQIATSRNRITQFAVFETPAKHKDANDWIRADQPDHAEVFKRVIENAKNPILKATKSVSDLLGVPVDDDPGALIGHKRRFLCKGGSWMIIGPSGIGKSTLITSLCIHAAAGVSWHGLTFRRPLKTIVVQAENDDGDLAEMLKGACAGVRAHFSEAEFKTMAKNLIFQQVTDKIGQGFCQWLEEMIRESGAEFLIIDPLLSFVGDDISQQKVASQFFRTFLQPVLKRTGAICAMIHHTGKPPKEKIKDADLSYSGLGSSEVVNWPRAVSVLMPTDEPGIFLFKNTKRGGRAEMVNQFTGQIATEIFLKHGDRAQGSQWLQVKHEASERPATEERSSMNPEKALGLVGGCFTYKDLYDSIVQGLAIKPIAAKKLIGELIMSRAIVKGADGFYRKGGEG